MKTTAKEIVDYLYTKYGTDSGILFGISEKAVVELIVQQTINKLQIYDADVNINSKLRKALETIRDAFWTEGETDAEKLDDLKAIAFNVLYEIDNMTETE